VISIVTEKPQYEWGGSAEATVGNYNMFRVAGDVTGPLAENIAFSLGANYNTRDGYADDLNTGADINDRNRWGVRGQLLIEPTEDLSFRIIGDFDKIDETCCVAGNIVNGMTGAAIFALGGQIDPENPFSYEVYNNLDSSNDVENSGLSVQADYALGFADVTSITAYRSSKLKTDQDSDFTSADLLARNANDTDIDTFTQEIRLTSTGDGAIDWMVGGFYFDESVDIENQILYGQDIRGYIDFLSQGLLTGLERWSSACRRASLPAGAGDDRGVRPGQHGVLPVRHGGLSRDRPPDRDARPELYAGQQGRVWHGCVDGYLLRDRS
jgi:iron complex outermembrane receptor protein